MGKEKDLFRAPEHITGRTQFPLCVLRTPASNHDNKKSVVIKRWAAIKLGSN